MFGVTGAGTLRDRKTSQVLICVTGLTPQVVTETVFALGREGQQMLPDEIHVLTTLEGRRRAVPALTGETGRLARLYRDHGWNAQSLRFGADHIRVIRDATGRELEDIQNEDDNAAAADFITGFIRRMTTDNNARLHVSLAGGRKTMGFFVGCALSLYGRAEDRLSHVLVNPPFEFHPEFFYPPRRAHRLKTGDGTAVSTADARVRLADIPFVRLRNGLDQELIEGNLSFSGAVARTQQLIDPPALRIDLATREVTLQGHPLRLSETLFIWLVWFAGRASRELTPTAFDEHGARSLLAIVEWLDGSTDGRPGRSVRNAMRDLERADKGYFERNHSRLNRALRGCPGLAAAAAERYLVQSSPTRTPTTYALGLTPGQICIEGEP